MASKTAAPQIVLKQQGVVMRNGAGTKCACVVCVIGGNLLCKNYQSVFNYNSMSKAEVEI